MQVCTILSQNTTDVNSARAFAKLKQRFPEWELVRTANNGIPLPRSLADTSTSYYALVDNLYCCNLLGHKDSDSTVGLCQLARLKTGKQMASGRSAGDIEESIKSGGLAAIKAERIKVSMHARALRKTINSDSSRHAVLTLLVLFMEKQDNKISKAWQLMLSSVHALH